MKSIVTVELKFKIKKLKVKNLYWCIIDSCQIDNIIILSNTYLSKNENILYFKLIWRKFQNRCYIFSNTN